MPTAGSTQLITDTASVQATAPTPGTAAAATTAGMDYTGMASALAAAPTQARSTVGQLAAVTVPTDPNAAKLAATAASLV